MCDPRRKDHKQGTDVPLKFRQYCDRNDDRVIKDVPSRSEGNIFNDDHGCPSHRDKSSQFLFEHPKPSPCHATLSTAACSAFSYSSSSSSSSSFSSFFSSSSSASSSSVNSNTSSECRVRCAFKKPWYSRSCTDISEKRGYFEEDCDTAPLIEMKGSKRGSAKNKLATQSPVQECLPKTRKIPSGSKTDGNVRKSKSMEALVRPKDKGGHEDENEQGMRESEARKELVKEKMKFSAFLNEITRQVLSPVRLTTLGVKDAHPSCGPPQACGQSEKSEKRQRSQSASADSPASNQNVRSRKQPSVNQPPSKSFHQNPMHNPAHSAALSVSPRTGSSTDVRCLKSPQAHRHQKHYNHQHKGEHAFTPHCHESRNCSSQCHHHHHHHHHQTHNSAYHPEDLHNMFPNSRGHNKLHPQEEHHLRHPRHGGHRHGDPHHRDHEQGGYCYADHHRRRHCSETGDSNGPTPPFGHCRRRCHKNHRSDDYHMDCGDEHGPALHHGGNSVANDSDCTTRRRDGHYLSTKEGRALRLLGDHDSESQISSEREADRPGHIRDHHLDHHGSSDRDDYQRSGYQRCRHNSYSDSHHHHHRHQHGNYGCSDHQLNHDDCISRAHRHYRKNTIKSPPHHHHHHHHHDRRHQREAYSHHRVNHHYSKPHPYHHGNQPHSESHQRHYASPCVEHRQKVRALGLQDNADARGRRSPFSCSSPAHGKLETESAMTTRSPSSHDVEQMSFLDSSSIHKEETHETGRTMVLQEKNEHVYQSLQKTAVRTGSLGEDFINSQKLLETELQKTKTELSNLTMRFMGLQASCSSTQHSNDLLQKKLSLVTQSMEDERERLNIRISVLTEKLADVKFLNGDTEIISKTLSSHLNTSIHFESDELTNQMVHPVTHPPAQFTDDHDYDKPKVVGQEQSLRSVPEEEESDWSEMGEETPRLMLSRTSNRNAAWRNQEVDLGNQISGSASEELVGGHSAQKPHLHFTFHGEVLPSLPTSTRQSDLKSPSEGLTCESNYRITSSPNLGSSILIRSASLGEMPVVNQRLQQELKSTEAMMDLYQPGSEVMEDLDGHIIHNWKTSSCVQAATASSMEAKGSLVGLHSAEQMLNSLIAETQPSEGKREDRAEELGWTGGIPDEVLKLEWTKL